MSVGGKTFLEWWGGSLPGVGVDKGSSSPVDIIHGGVGAGLLILWYIVHGVFQGSYWA